MLGRIEGLKGNIGVLKTPDGKLFGFNQLDIQYETSYLSKGDFVEFQIDVNPKVAYKLCQLKDDLKLHKMFNCNCKVCQNDKLKSNYTPKNYLAIS